MHGTRRCYLVLGPYCLGEQDFVICSHQVQFEEVAGSTEGMHQFSRMRQGIVVDDYCLVGFSEVDAKTDAAVFLADNNWGNPFGCTSSFSDVSASRRFSSLVTCCCKASGRRLNLSFSVTGTTDWFILTLCCTPWQVPNMVRKGDQTLS